MQQRAQASLALLRQQHQTLLALGPQGEAAAATLEFNQLRPLQAAIQAVGYVDLQIAQHGLPTPAALILEKTQFDGELTVIVQGIEQAAAQRAASIQAIQEERTAFLQAQTLYWDLADLLGRADRLGAVARFSREQIAIAATAIRDAIDEAFPGGEVAPAAPQALPALLVEIQRGTAFLQPTRQAIAQHEAVAVVPPAGGPAAAPAPLFAAVAVPAAAPLPPFQPAPTAQAALRALELQRVQLGALEGDHAAQQADIDAVTAEIRHTFAIAYPNGNEQMPAGQVQVQNFMAALQRGEQLHQRVGTLLAAAPPAGPAAVDPAAVAGAGAAPAVAAPAAPRAVAEGLLRETSNELRSFHEQAVLRMPEGSVIGDGTSLPPVLLSQTGVALRAEAVEHDKRARMLNALKEVVLAEEAVRAAFDGAVNQARRLDQAEGEYRNLHMKLNKIEGVVATSVLAITVLATMESGDSLVDCFSEELMWAAIAMMILKSIQIAAEYGKGASLAAKFSQEHPERIQGLEQAQEQELARLQQTLAELNRQKLALQTAFVEARDLLEPRDQAFIQQQIDNISTGIAECSGKIAAYRSDREQSKDRSNIVKGVFVVATVLAVLGASGAFDKVGQIEAGDVKDIVLAIASIALVAAVAYGAKTILKDSVVQAPQQGADAAARQPEAPRR